MIGDNVQTWDRVHDLPWAATFAMARLPEGVGVPAAPRQVAQCALGDVAGGTHPSPSPAGTPSHPAGLRGLAFGPPVTYVALSDIEANQ